MRFSTLALALALTALAGSTTALAADPIGAAAKVEDTLTGPAGTLVTGASIYFNDKLKTDATGVGQIVFKDDTKLAIGPNAEVTIDKFVYNDDGSFKELAVGLTKGTFRWISGKSKPEAYKLSTGWANLAIRGTAFDVNVDPAGSLTLVLYEGEVTVCLAVGDCRTIAGHCQYIVSETRIEVRDPDALPSSKAQEFKASGLIPFIDNEHLIKPFHVKNASCKVRKTQRQRKAQRTLRARTQRAQRTTRTKTAALSAKPASATVKSVTIGKAKGRLAANPDPTPPSTPVATPSAVPDPIDSPTPTVDTPTVDDGGGKTGHRGRHGHRGKGGKGSGNPGNDGDNGNAGENPGGGDFGGGENGKGDTHGKSGKGGGNSGKGGKGGGGKGGGGKGGGGKGGGGDK